jgi:hypothetical protein
MKMRNILRGGLIFSALVVLSLIHVQAQNGNIQAENSNSSKATKKKPYVIIQPDLVIEGARVEPNDERKLGVLVANRGNVASKACNLKIFYHRSGSVMVRGAVVSALPPGETLWVLVNIGSPLSAASKVTMRVDDPNRVRESNEGNNAFIYK